MSRPRRNFNCQADNCARIAHAKGYCSLHYGRVKNDRAIDAPVRARDGREKHPAYKCYRAMLRRCYHPSTYLYHRYGGRGISVCEEWVKDFWQFSKDMGERPRGYSIDRLDSDGNYEPSNCRWASVKEQSYNRSNSKKYPGVNLHSNGYYGYTIIRGAISYRVSQFGSDEEAHQHREKLVKLIDGE